MGHGHHEEEIIPPKKLELPKNYFVATLALFGVGMLTFFGLLGSGNAEMAWKGYVIGFWFSLGLALSGPFILSTQVLSNAGWYPTIRRVVESYGTYIYVAAVIGLIGMFGVESSGIYAWMSPEAIKDPIFAKKAAFLNKEMFYLFTAGFFALWSALYFLIRKTSLEQDETGDYALTNRLKVLCVLFLLSFGTGVSFMSWFWLMSLEPNWFSTMFSVYAFAGLFQSGLALTYILTVVLGTRGIFGSFATMRTVHYVGQLVFGFTTFYAYIGFCQFLLIWYANIPEEDVWYNVRLHNGWEYFTLALPFIKFIIPFLIMLPQAIKKNKNNVMFFVCMWLIFAQLFEIWYWVAPTPHGLHIPGAHGGGPAAGPTVMSFATEIVIGLGFGGLFAAVAGWAFSRHNSIPVKDPYLYQTLSSYTHEEPLMEIEEF